ncbi:hypothetical protein AAFF_G00299320 [Aldrovandia affinis]|uniref:Leucine-rich repeat-containing protein 74B n=1 Tax=Aldrovandia affinis TaxID=143900 RepID=A0AAD7W0Z3_9TELE|nr:hypothetical protein AAFF_G00299320 [Aldrovandia affinis]
MESELVSEVEQLGGIGSRPPSRPRNPYSRGSVDNQTVTRIDADTSPSQSASSGQSSGGGKEVPETETGREWSQPRDGPGNDAEAETMHSSNDEDNVRDLEIKDEKVPFVPTDESRYQAACKIYGVVPVRSFLQNIHASELNMMHCGLGLQHIRALAVSLVTNTSILKLNLKDNRLEGLGGVAIAEMLKENCYITEINLSENKLGVEGAHAISSMLMENSTLVSINLSGNHFNDHAAIYLAEALKTNQKVEDLDLSYNKMGSVAGELLGEAIAENTAMKVLNLSWNCIRGSGALALAKSLGANIFLRKVDLSYNGLAKEGAATLGEALTLNNVLEELNLSINQIPLEGAVSFAMGLQKNKTLRILGMGRNPMQCLGCIAVLKAIQENPESALEFLDFSEIPVDQDFMDLYDNVKETFPSLQVKHGVGIGIKKKQHLSVSAGAIQRTQVDD